MKVQDGKCIVCGKHIETYQMVPKKGFHYTETSTCCGVYYYRKSWVGENEFKIKKWKVIK